jgi:hypothetical protein
MPTPPAPSSSDSLAQAESVAGFDQVSRADLQSFDELGAGIIEKQSVKLACCAGCSICCSLRVDVFAHEVFLIAHYIWSHFSPEELATLHTRLAAHEDRVLPLTPYEHATTNIRCPLLRDDGCCSVYAARPHSCRRHHSQDLAACQYTYDHPADLETPAAHHQELYYTLTEAMLQGFEKYAELGYDPTIYELGTAVAEALRDPTSWSRWRNGGHAFLHASITPPA